MRRPVMYLAGLLLATGASFALAGPASAAVSHGGPGGDDFYYSSFEDSSRSLDIDSDSSREYGPQFLPILSPQGDQQIQLLTFLSSMTNGGN
jgi:hypothetical protein